MTSLPQKPEPIKIELRGKYKNQIQKKWLKEAFKKYIQVG
jgi:hypothetical protein